MDMSDLPYLHQVYFDVAVACTVIFLLKFAGLFIGGEGLGGYNDGNFPDYDISGDGSMDSSEAFSVLTFQSFLAFGMVFSWATLALHYEFELDFTLANVFSFVLGLGGAILSAYLMHAIKKMNTKPKTHLEVKVGQEGKVYLKELKAEEKDFGYVELIIDQSRFEFKATTKDKEDIKVGDKILVIEVNGKELIVTKKEKENV